MKILEKPKIQMPPDIDEQCLALCNTLNRLPYTRTFESCCGHGQYPYRVWFKCGNMEVISRLGRTVSRNYSDGNWEIIVDSTDTSPCGIFCLQTNVILTESNMEQSVDELIENILYWFDDDFDEYFKMEEQQ